jgi:tRNA modification GTPase
MAAVRPTIETIAAIATAPGAAGIGIVRISGPGAEAALSALFRPKDPERPLLSHQLRYGTVVDAHGAVLDEVLAVIMRAPNSYTREDVVEIHSHGSSHLLHAILHRVLAQGVRLAEAGEFTKRAFLAGRIDLTQAEAVADLIQARTATSARLAVQQVQGALHTRILAIRAALIELLAIIEVAIDFPDEDQEILQQDAQIKRLDDGVVTPLQELLATAEQGRVLREGFKVVIAGRPNVGKSSLLNALLREERALVTEIPGTTRDTIEEWIDVHGLPVHLVDTAGIREHDDPVEGMGIDRARRKMAEADLVLFMIDGGAELTQTDLDLYDSVCDRRHLVLINKVDVATQEALEALDARFGQKTVHLAAAKGQGIDAVLSALHHIALGEEQEGERLACAPNLRHRTALLRAYEASLSVRQALLSGLATDLLAIELQTALDQLGDIVGLTTPDEVLDAIFTQFCLGK